MGSWDLPFQISRNCEVGITDNVNTVIGVDFLALCRILWLAPCELIIALLTEWGHSAVMQRHDQCRGLQWSNLEALRERQKNFTARPTQGNQYRNFEWKCYRTSRTNNLWSFYKQKKKESVQPKGHCFSH